MFQMLILHVGSLSSEIQQKKQTNILNNVPVITVHIFIQQVALASRAQEITRRPFGLLIKLSTAHLPTTHGGGFILPFLMAERQAGKL